MSEKAAAVPSDRIFIGISTCLLGEKVRFDGGHKKNDLVVNSLSEFFEWVPVCPEVEIGLGTPRESLRLVGNSVYPRFVTSKTGIDHTEKMLEFSRSKLREIARMNLDGYILKKDSPSCGMERVRVYGESGMPNRNGSGIFARELMNHLPYLPVEEEGRLLDMRLRENFITRVFCHHRWQKLIAQFKLGDLVEFHARHKYLLMAHSEKHMRQMGQLVSQASSAGAEQLFADYSRLFFEALRLNSTRRKHVNVLQHILGFFKKQVDDSGKRELLQVIEDYRHGLLPLIVPVTLIKHYVNRFDIAYIKNQVYLNPHPKELMLINHV